MKRIQFLLFVAILPVLVSFKSNNLGGGLPEVVSIKATDTAMIFTVTTQTYGGQYTPKHCLAIWVTDNNNVFKKTLKLAASTYKMHLVKWNQMSAGNVTDAITGPSLTAHTTHTVVWNGKDKNGVLQPDGTYKVYIEFTEDNSLSSSIPDGPWTAFTFTKGTSQIQNPSDVTFTYGGQTKTVYKNIQIQTFGAASVEENFNIKALTVYPNPTNTEAQIKVTLEKPAILDIKITDSKGVCVHQYPKQTYHQGEHIFFWYPNLENAKAGTYFVSINDGVSVKTLKILVK